jgi:hypothetical protein
MRPRAAGDDSGVIDAHSRACQPERRSVASRLVPAWANFFDDDAFGAFVAEVERDLARRGHAVIEDGVADLEIDGGDRHRLGLQNLAQLCNQVERDDWPELVREHFDRVILSTHTHDLDALGHDFEAVKPLLKVRLYARESLGELETNTVHRPMGEELVAVLVYDLPDAVATVPVEAPQGWPASTPCSASRSSSRRACSCSSTTWTQ